VSVLRALPLTLRTDDSPINPFAREGWMLEQGDGSTMERLLHCCCTGVVINVVDSSSCKHTATHLGRADYLVSVELLAECLTFVSRAGKHGRRRCSCQVGKLATNSLLCVCEHTLARGRWELVSPEMSCARQRQRLWSSVSACA